MRIIRSIDLRVALVGLAILSLAVTGCSQAQSESASSPPTGDDVVLRISGSGTATAILQAIEATFETDTPGYQLELLPGTGTGGGVEGVLGGVLDVAAMARPPRDEEAAEGVQYTEFGKSAVAVFAHASVDIASLTTEQLVAVFSGEITNWSALGGPDKQITLFVRDEEESSTEALREAFLGDAAFSVTAAQVMTSQTQMLDAVAGTPDSVGFGSWPAALAEGADVRAIALDDVTPGDPAYPVVTPVGIGYKADDAAVVQPLSDWLLSEQGQAALREVEVIITP